MGPRAGLDGGKSYPTGIRSPDHPARIQSLYRLSYPAHMYSLVFLIIIGYIPHVTNLINGYNITLLTELICFFRVSLKYASYLSRKGFKSSVILPIAVAARSKAWVCIRSRARIVGSHLVGAWMFCLLCVMRYRVEVFASG